MKKRVLSTLLALLFAVSLIPAALAAAPPDLDLASEATVELNKKCEVPLEIDLSLYYDKGNIPKYTSFKMTSDHAVPGMGYNYNSAGQPVISGTPTSSGVYDLDFLLLLSDGRRVFYNLILTVTKPAVTSSQTFDLTANQAFTSPNLDLKGISGTIQDVKVVGGDSVPGNLKLEKTQNTAYYAGTVTKAGTYTIQAEITFVNGEKVRHTATLKVAAPAVASTHTVTAENCYIITGEYSYDTEITAKAGDVIQMSFTVLDYFHKEDMGRRFDHWEVTPSSVIINADDTFIMPDQDVKIVGVAQKLTSISVDPGSGPWLFDDHMFPNDNYTITADDPPEGQVFDHWEVVSGGVTLADPTNPRTSFTVGTEDVVIKAVFKEKSASSATYTIVYSSQRVWDSPWESVEERGDWLVDLPAGTEVTVVDTQGNWSKIILEDGYGWVESAYLVPKSDVLNPFTDVTDRDKYYPAVLWAYHADPQVTKGVSDTKFGPAETVTRGQCVTFLWRSMGCPEPKTTKNPFVDVKASEYWYKPILWAVENGITVGVDSTHFAPKATLSTRHIVTFLYRTVNPGKGGPNGGWNGEAAAWAAEQSGNVNMPFYVEISVNDKTPCPRWCVVQFLWKVKFMERS